MICAITTKRQITCAITEKKTDNTSYNGKKDRLDVLSRKKDRKRHRMCCHGKKDKQHVLSWKKTACVIIEKRQIGCAITEKRQIAFFIVVVDSIAPFKTKRVKANAQKSFDGEVLENINTRDKLFKKFKKSRLHINKELYKKAKYNRLKLIAAKKREFFDDKLTENVGKPKELWETLKSLGMPHKSLISNFNAIESNITLIFDKKTIAKIFKDFSNLAESL